MQVAKQPETDSNSRKYPCTNCNFQQKPKQGNAEKQGDKQEDANEPEVCCQYTDVKSTASARRSRNGSRSSDLSFSDIASF